MIKRFLNKDNFNNNNKLLVRSSSSSSSNNKVIIMKIRLMFHSFSCRMKNKKVISITGKILLIIHPNITLTRTMKSNCISLNPLAILQEE